MPAAIEHSSRSERGNSLVETALMCPWVFFLLVGILDVGFYNYAAICTQNAARVAALIVASSPTAGTAEACAAAARELSSLPNSTQFAGGCAGPLRVQVAVGNVSGEATRRVTVTYTTIPLIPIPGVLTGQLQFTRTAEVILYD